MKNTNNKFLTGAAVFLIAMLALAGNAGTVQAAEPTVETRSATDITNDSVRLNGRVNPEGRSTDFWFEYGRDLDLDEDTTVQRLDGFDAEVSVFHNIHGLREDTTYFFRLVAENSDGIERGQIRSFTTDDDDGDDFDDDEEPFVSTGSVDQFGTSVVLNGDVDPNANWAQVWFRYGRSSGSLNERTNILTLMGSASRTFSRTLSRGALTPGVTYFYQAVAENASGESRGQIRSFVAGGTDPGGPGPVTGSAPQAITNSATVLGRNSANLQAQVNPNGQLSSVWFEFGRTTSLGGATTRDSAGSSVSLTNYSVTLTGLSAGTTYYYRAVSQNPFGTSRGQLLSFTTQGAPVTPPPVTPPGGGDDDDGDDEPPAQPTNGSGCLELSPALSLPQVQAGQDLAYTVTYRNDCGRGLTSATLQLTLPAAVDFAGTNIAFLSRDGNVITYSIGDIAENFQAAVTVDARVKEQVNPGDSLLFEANMNFTDSAGRPRTESGFVSAVITGEPVVENGTSTLGASIGDALGGLFQNGWFWLVLFLILIALFIFWLATRRRQDEDDEDEIITAQEA